MSEGQGTSVVKRAFIALKEADEEIQRLREGTSEPIAIVGAGCRFPGGLTSPESFWRALENGTDAVGPVSEARARLIVGDEPRRALGGFIDDIDEFDASFFAISPREAISMDPTQRILLEVSVEALQNAAIPTQSVRGGRVGVFVGFA